MLNRKWILALAFLGLLLMAGCGNGGSDTSGNLALTVTPTDLTGGQFSVLATAVYTPAPSTTPVVPQGVPITITMSIHTLNGTPFIIKKDLKTDTSGTVTFSTNIGQTSEVTYVDVTASTGGLSRSQSVGVPALSATTP